MHGFDHDHAGNRYLLTMVVPAIDRIQNAASVLLAPCKHTRTLARCFPFPPQGHGDTLTQSDSHSPILPLSVSRWLPPSPSLSLPLAHARMHTLGWAVFVV